MVGWVDGRGDDMQEEGATWGEGHGEMMARAVACVHMVPCRGGGSHRRDGGKEGKRQQGGSRRWQGGV